MDQRGSLKGNLKNILDWMKINIQQRRDLQDGRGVRHGDHLPPHKYDRNTSTCGTTPTNTYWTLAEDLWQCKRQENPHVPG